MKYLLVSAALLLPSTALADAIHYNSSAGHRYSYSTNKNGGVLKSVGPVSRSSGQGGGIETIYLGKSCDAYSDVLGHGTWGWANGGFIVSFPKESVAFPRQEIYVPDESDCTL